MKRVYNVQPASSHKPSSHKHFDIKKYTLNQVLTISLCVVLLICAIAGITYIIVLNSINPNAVASSPNAHALDTTEISSTQSPIIVIKNDNEENNNVKSMTVEYNGPQLYENDIVDISNITSNLIYEDDSLQTINSNDITFSDNIYEPLALGNTDIVATYHDFTWTFTLNTIQKNYVTTAVEEYSDELENADYKYVSDNTFITITKAYSPDTYYIAHVIINNPSQLSVAMAYDTFGKRQTSKQNELLLNWLLGINGSYFTNQNTALDGIYINKGYVYQTTADNTAVGYEMCITDDGTLFTAQAGTSLTDLTNAGVQYTINADTPTLISNNVKLDLPETTNTPKTAVGQVSNHEYYMLVASNGSWSCHVTYADIQNIFANLNCSYARILDGSTNTSMMFDGTTINEPACGPGRPLKDLLVIYDE